MASLANSLGRCALGACRRQIRSPPCTRSHIAHDLRQPWRRQFTQSRGLRQSDDVKDGVKDEVKKDVDIQERSSTNAEETPAKESTSARASDSEPAQPSQTPNRTTDQSARPPSPSDAPDSICLLEPEIQELWPFIPRDEKSPLLHDAELQYAQLSEAEKHALRNQAHDLRQRHQQYGVRPGSLSDAALQALGAGDRRRPKLGFWNMDAVRPDQEGLDEPFGNDDVAPAAHAELEQQREIREYARWVAWELPLLSKYARPFEPPKKTHPLRFRYTTYLGEDHPAARKVVVELDPNDLPNLSEQQRDKLIKIAGSRYHPGTGIIKMSSEAFGTQAQNKRFLGDTINGLIAEARDGKDTFEDVPFDFRYYTPKPFHEFPKEWIMTPERKQELEQRRIAQLEGFGESRGDAVPLLDGTSAAEKVEEPVMIRSRLRAREAPMERPSFMPRP